MRKTHSKYAIFPANGAVNTPNPFSLQVYKVLEVLHVTHRGMRPLLFNKAIVMVNTYYGTTTIVKYNAVVLTGTNHPTSFGGFPPVGLEDV
jgi:hypothetical protein